MKPQTVVFFGLTGVCAVYGLTAVPAYPGRCIVVTNGTKAVLNHEKAHCAGWTHEPFEYAAPPPELIDAYTGEIEIIKCGRKYQCKSVQKRCFALWREYGYDYQTFAGKPGYRTFNGCSVK